MVKDAEAHAEEDKKTRESIEAKNNAESVIYQTEKALSDYGDKITADEKSKIEAAIKELKDAIAANASADELKSKTEKVQQASMQLGQKVYEAAQQAQSQGAAGNADNSANANAGQSSSKNDDGSVDADFEEVK